MSETVTNARVDADLCIGSLECNRIAAAAFRIDEDTGVSEPLPGAGLTERDLLIAAARGCPTQAISLHDEDGGVVYEGGS